MNEESLILKLTQDWKSSISGLVGVGDDCAVIPHLNKNRFSLFKTDALVEGVHFLKTADSRLIGRKALARALSDMGAMGGKPLYGLVTLGLPQSFQQVRIEKIYQGITALAREWKVQMVGGETTRTRELMFSVSVWGETLGHAPVLRSTAKEGDEIWVTGTLGGSQKKKHFLFEPRIPEGEWLAKQGVASAMMDLSDGLGADLPKLARASKLSFDLDLDRIPKSSRTILSQAFQEGEDYELLFTVSPQKVNRLKKFPFSTPLTKIGVMRKKSFPLRAEIQNLLHGYDHLKKR